MYPGWVQAADGGCAKLAQTRANSLRGPESVTGVTNLCAAWDAD
jgi:hypothetical protein